MRTAGNRLVYDRLTNASLALTHVNGEKKKQATCIICKKIYMFAETERRILK